MVYIIIIRSTLDTRISQRFPKNWQSRYIQYILKHLTENQDTINTQIDRFWYQYTGCPTSLWIRQNWYFSKISNNWFILTIKKKFKANVKLACRQYWVYLSILWKRQKMQNMLLKKYFSIYEMVSKEWFLKLFLFS